MAFSEDPLKIYLSSRDLEKAYKERRWSIRQQLSTLSMQDLQRKKAAYDEDLADLNERLAKLHEQLAKVKAGASSFTLEERGTVREVTAGPAEACKILEGLISNIKRAMQWLRRERQIYVWEIRRRRLNAAKLSILKLCLRQRKAECSKILSQIRECCQQLKGLCEAYNRAYFEAWNARREISLLSNEDPQITVSSLDPKVLHLIDEIATRLPSE